MTHSKELTTVRHMVADGLTKPLPLYTHATIHNDVVYVSAIQGFTPGTFDLPQEVLEEARQVLRNLKTVLEQAGSDLRHVLKITVIMTDLKNFDKINEAVNEAFPEFPPARSSMAMPELPRGAKVYIDAIAAVKEG